MGNDSDNLVQIRGINSEIEDLQKTVKEMNELLLDVLRHAVAMESVLTTANKSKVPPAKVWASDKMFAVAMRDYRRSIKRTRDYLKQRKKHA